MKKSKLPMTSVKSETSETNETSETSEKILKVYSRDKAEIKREINCLQDQINDVFTLCQKIANIVQGESDANTVTKSAFTPWGKKYKLNDEVATKYVLPGVIGTETIEVPVEPSGAVVDKATNDDNLIKFDILKRLGKKFRQSGCPKVNEEILLIVEELDKEKLYSHKTVAKILTTKIADAQKYEYLSSYRDIQLIWENMIHENVNGNITGLIILAFCGLGIQNEIVRLDATTRKKLRKLLNDTENRSKVQNGLSKAIMIYQKWFRELKNPKRNIAPRTVVCSGVELYLTNSDPIIASNSLMEIL